MPNYRVTWTIDIEDADSPEEAARQARHHQTAEDTTAVVFEVMDVETGESAEVDLQGEG